MSNEWTQLQWQSWKKNSTYQGSLDKICQNERLSIFKWETVSFKIANAINDLSLALGNTVRDYENMDLLTPNRLKWRRNNERSPVSPISIAGKFSKIVKMNKRIFNTWFETWLVNHKPKLIHQPTWFQRWQSVWYCTIHKTWKYNY